MIQVKAQLNGLRIAPRKVRALVNLVRGKDVQVAVDQLEHFTRRSGPALVKLLQSAVANASNNFKLDKDSLYIKEMFVDEGTKLKRFMPKGFGRAGEIQKKTSRVSVVLESRNEEVKAEKKVTIKKEEDAEIVAPVKAKRVAKKKTN